MRQIDERGYAPMKRMIALFMICLIFALSACGEINADVEEHPNKAEQIQIEPPASKPSDVPEPLPEPDPAGEKGIAAAYGIGVLYVTAERGTHVEIIGEDEAYYIVVFDGIELYIEKCFVRDVTAGIPEERTAYAMYGAEIYPGPYLTGEPVEKLQLNSILKVLDEFGDLMLVRSDRSEGYISAALVSPVWISSSAGDGNNSTESGQDSSGSAFIGGEDGGDITLGGRKTGAVVPVMLSARYEELQSGNKAPTQGMILADGTELYLGIVYPGDELMVLSAEGRITEIYTSRGTGTLPRWAVLLGDEDPYETWNGYAAYDAKLYDSYRLTGVYKGINLNTEISVILQTDDGYFVRLSDGTYGYTDRTAVSRNMTVFYESGDDSAPATEPDVGEWTDPVL